MNILIQTIVLMCWCCLSLADNRCPPELGLTFSPCKCSLKIYNRLTIDCTGNNLTEIPLLPSQTEIVVKILKMDDNYVGSIVEGDGFSSRGLRDLSQISMSNCQIISLDQDSFSGMSLLQTLDLSDNFISSLPVNIFSHLASNLHTLNLSNNKFITMPSSIISGFQHLRQLRLSDNPWNCDCHIRFLVDLLQTKYQQNSHIEIPCITNSSMNCHPILQTSPEPTWLGLGVMLNISCNITSYPEPKVTWYHNKSQLYFNTEFFPQGPSYIETRREQEGVFSVISTINIQTTTWSDLGQYRCTASNGEGDPVHHHVTLDLPQEHVGQFVYDLPLVVGVSAMTAFFVMLGLISILFCCLSHGHGKQIPGNPHSSSPSGFNYLNCRNSGTNPLPKPPRTGVYSRLSPPSYGPIVALSRSSTEGTTDTFLTSEDPLESLALLLPSNQPGSRASIHTNSSMTSLTHSDLYLAPSRSGTLSRPGYVTLPRRPRPSTPRPSYSSLGPRSLGDGCSTDSVFTNLQCNHLIDMSAFNTVGIPSSPTYNLDTSGLSDVFLENPGVNYGVITTEPSQHQLDTILEQE